MSGHLEVIAYVNYSLDVYDTSSLFIYVTMHEAKSLKPAQITRLNIIISINIDFWLI